MFCLCMVLLSAFFVCVYLQTIGRNPDSKICLIINQMCQLSRLSIGAISQMQTPRLDRKKADVLRSMVVRNSHPNSSVVVQR